MRLGGCLLLVGIGGDRKRERLHLQRVSVGLQVFEVATVRRHRAGTDRWLALALAGHLVADRHLVGQLEGLA
jgi:hypothetical protein